MAFGGNPFQPLASPDSEGPKIEVEPDELEEVETEVWPIMKWTWVEKKCDKLTDYCGLELWLSSSKRRL